MDLSDDDLVAALARDDWEAAAAPVQGRDAAGRMQRLQLSREGFYVGGLISLMQATGEDAMPPPPPPKGK